MTPPSVRLAASLADIECQPCGIFEEISYPKEAEFIYPANFVVSSILRYRIKRPVSSKFRRMMRVI